MEDSANLREVVINETYDFLVNGESLSVQTDFADGAAFNVITLTVEQLNSFEWVNADTDITITVNGIALENGKCEFALTEISETEQIHVLLTQGDTTREFTINTLNTYLPLITVEGTSQTPGDCFVSFINTRSIVKTDHEGNILYYRNEDAPTMQFGLWDFKTHQINGKTYYSYHSTFSDPGQEIVFTGHNPGERVIMDENYNEITRIRAIATEKNQGDIALDGHEFLLFDENHYIVMSYLQVEADNIPDQNQYTGDAIVHADKALLVAAYIQEVDHGEVVFEWLSTEHPELYSMFVPDPDAEANEFSNTDPNTNIDYVHLNAIVVDDDGNLVISCRRLNTMLKIDRNGGTGNLLWALSGLGDDFGLTDEQKTSGQHYLHYLGNGYFSAFNNNNDVGPTNLVLYHLNEDETALAEGDGFQCWVVPGTTEVEPGLPCPPHETFACGAFQIFSEYGVAGWGWSLSGDELFTEFQLDDASQITFQLRSIYDPLASCATYRVVKCLSAAPELDFTKDSASWSEVERSSGYMLSIKCSDTGDTVSLGFANTACDIYNLPNGEYAATITENDFGVSSAESTLTVEDNLTASMVISTENGLDDLFFVKATDKTWSSLYSAKHVGSLNDWAGTNETVTLTEKNQLSDIFIGSSDFNYLLLTDDDHGDALFLDDIYSEFPNRDDAQARIAKIYEICAGAGDDIVDLTSQRFEYVGDGMAVYGGLGDDVIWANKGDNLLFGDGGNDRIVGASGNDLIVGGAGDDALHGGGGKDVFTFGGNWGNDTVEQLTDGTITLWFKEGDESKWDAETLTYTDGANSVKVIGDCTNIDLKFGAADNAERFASLSAIGGFSDFSSERIFWNNNQGILA